MPTLFYDLMQPPVPARKGKHGGKNVHGLVISRGEGDSEARSFNWGCLKYNKEF